MKHPLIIVAAFLSGLSAAQGAEAIISTGSYPAPVGDPNDAALNVIRGGWVTGGYAGTAGVTFNVGTADLLVTSLGFYDGPNTSEANDSGIFGDGLLEEHQVGIYDNLGTLVTSISIPSGTSATLVGEFRYVTLPTSVTLLAGRNYTIAGQIPTASGATSDVWRNNTWQTSSFVFGTNLTPDTSGDGFSPRAYSGPPTNSGYLDGVFQAPNSNGPGYAAGNFQYTVVSPSASLAITGITRNLAGEVIIDFTGAPDTTYKVTKSANLATPFVPLTIANEPVTNNLGVGQATVPAAEASEPKEFYRIETP